MNLSRHGRPSNVSGVKKGKQTIFQKIEGRKLNNKEYWAAIQFQSFFLSESIIFCEKILLEQALSYKYQHLKILGNIAL